MLVLFAQVHAGRGMVLGRLRGLMVGVHAWRAVQADDVAPWAWAT